MPTLTEALHLFRFWRTSETPQVGAVCNSIPCTPHTDGSELRPLPSLCPFSARRKCVWAMMLVSILLILHVQRDRYIEAFPLTLS